MFSYFKTIKNSVMVLMLIFTLFTTFIVFTYSLYLTYSFQKRITIKSTEYNLQLISNIIEKDIDDVASFAKWCTTNNFITSYINSSDNKINTDGILAYNTLNKEFTKTRIIPYVRRLIVVDKDFTKILQVGNIGSSYPINIYNINKLRYLTSSDEVWPSVEYDPFYPVNKYQILPFSTPIYNDNVEVGKVYLAASTSIITDKLTNYSLISGSKLYLTLDNHKYLIDNKNFIPVEYEFEVIEYDTENAISKKTTVAYIKDEKNKQALSITYTIKDNISLVQVIPVEKILLTQGNWFIVIVIICIAILFLALFIAYLMDKNISKPITVLKNRIDLISEGDFSYDKNIESNNELGQVGEGINKLSHDINALMESRIEDEKNKRKLEYRMLQNQINPHFLYNTLNSIKMMAVIQSADGIAEMTTSLSKLLKTISKDNRTLVPLKDELELLDSYILIQKYRYSDSVSVIKNIEDERLLEALIPRFSLQPFVENAIFHGIEPKGKGRITIDVFSRDNIVHCCINDDGVGISRDAIKKILSNDTINDGVFGSIGIRNVDERLRNSFGEDFGIIIRSEIDSYTSITIRLPFETNNRKEK